MNENNDNKEVSLVGLTREEIKDSLIKFDIPDQQINMRVNQVWGWIYNKGVTSIDEMTTLSLGLREELKKYHNLNRPVISDEQTSEDGTKKWLLKFNDGSEIETVFIPDNERGTLCVSSQVGCTLNCTFCHTGTQRLVRNLSSQEIISQVVVAKDSLEEWCEEPRKITNIVMMGMGEPLLNFEPVVNAMNLMTDDNAYGLSKRKVTLSTSGIVPKIDELSKVSDVALTISLHAPNDELRNELVPINKKYPIQQLLDSVKRYVDSCDDKRVTTIEYILIDGINDELSHAKELGELLKQLPSKINLIPFNAFEGSDYLKPSGNRVKRFQQYLQEQGYITTIRSTRGDDIMAACGQLVGQVNDKTRKKERAKKNLIQTKAI